MPNQPLTLFKGFYDTAGQAGTLTEVLRLIREDQWLKEHTEKYRYLLSSPANKKEAEAAKRKTLCFAVAVRFAGGKSEEHIDSWTGLTLADFDHLPADKVEELKALAAQDPHTLLAYTTISGRGLRIVSKVKLPEEKPEQHYPTLFRMMNDHYARLLGYPPDAQCKNATRLSGLAHDPNAVFRPEAIAFEAVVKPPMSKRLKRTIAAAEQELKRDGVEYLPGKHNRYILRMGCLMNLYGVEQKEATDWAVTEFSDYDGDVAGIFKWCYEKHSKDHGLRSLPRKLSEEKPEKKSIATVNDIKAYLNEIATYRWNCVNAKTEYRPTNADDTWHEVDDRFVNSAWCALSERFAIVSERKLPLILESDFVPCFHPFEAYFGSLPPWDGHDHIADLAARVKCVPTEDPDDDLTFDEALRHWLVSMVAALFDPEKVNEEILVLVGKQGTYKTTWMSMLLPPELRSYFLTKPNSDHFDKDDRIALSEFAVVCLEELDVIQPRELSQLKSLSSQRRSHERAPYMRYKRQRTNIASLCGTSNVVQFLTDRSKNRRWLVFEVESIDSPYDHPIPYEQLYAQVMELLHDGYQHLFEGADIDRINRHNLRYELPDLEAELILHYFRKPLEYEQGDFLTASEIYQRISYGIRTPLALNRITELMKQLGFKSVRSLNRRGFLVKNS